MIATTGLCQKTVLSQRVERQRGMPRRAHVVTRAVSSSDVDVVQPRAVVRIRWMEAEWRGRGRRIDVHFGEFRRSVSRSCPETPLAPRSPLPAPHEYVPTLPPGHSPPRPLYYCALLHRMQIARS